MGEELWGQMQGSRGTFCDDDISAKKNSAMHSTLPMSLDDHFGSAFLSPTPPTVPETKPLVQARRVSIAEEDVDLGTGSDDVVEQRSVATRTPETGRSDVTTSRAILQELREIRKQQDLHSRVLMGLVALQAGIALYYMERLTTLLRCTARLNRS